ncbi:MAG: helix-turn-helix domain-containing protein [Myxococcales bacterium]|nr:helix-turn-helix domain-containing protein [Myxococcales bacterium]
MVETPLPHDGTPPAAVRVVPARLRAVDPSELREATAVAAVPIKLGRQPGPERVEHGAASPSPPTAALPPPPAPVATPPRARPPVPSRDEFVAAWAQHGHSVRAVARHFGRDRRQIYRWLEAHGLRTDGETDAEG